MPMSEAFRNYILDGGDGCDIITHLGLVDAGGTEITGGSPAYTRIAVTWTAASGGLRRPSADSVFNIPASGVVAGWRGFTALTAGTNYGGKELPSESFTGQGTYTLKAATTSITASDPA